MSIASEVRLESGQFRMDGHESFVAALPKLVADVARETRPSEVASRIASAFVRVLGARTARVYSNDADGGTLHLVAAENVDAPTRARLASVSVHDDQPAARAVRSGLVQVVDSSDAPTFGRRPGPRGVAGVGGGIALALPLLAGGATVGAVSAGLEDLSPSACVALGMLSHSLGALVERARLREDVARLEASARRRDECMALVAHELGQPLNLVLMNAGALARRAEERDQVSLERLRRGARLPDRMISDLRDTTFLESGRYSLSSVPADVRLLVEAVVARHAPLAEVSVHGTIPQIAIDAQRIEQVLANLLVNAEKYGRAETVPRVDLSLLAGAVVVSVTNDGEAIPVDERRRLFEPYHRAPSRLAGKSGLGLGLYVCRKLVEQHGGRIWADSQPRGMRFSFSLPIAPSGAKPVTVS